MITSILLVDAHALATRNGPTPDPASLVDELTQTMHGVHRQIVVLHAYCDASVRAPYRQALRDAGFAIFDTANAHETLIAMTLDLAGLVGGESVYEEAILLGHADYTALARHARAALMMVSVADHPGVCASLEALADGLIDLDEMQAFRPEEVAVPAGAAAQAEEPAEEPAEEGDPWPDPSTGPMLVAGAAAIVPPVVEAALPAASTMSSIPELPDLPDLPELPELPDLPDPGTLTLEASQSGEAELPEALPESRQAGDQAGEHEGEHDPLDALFADLAQPVMAAPAMDEPAVDEAEPVAPVPHSEDEAVLWQHEPADVLVHPATPVNKDLTAEVDELLSRLMSDSLSPRRGSSLGVSAPDLDVVPER